MGMNEILPGLYLGDAASSRDLVLLQSNLITHILVVGSRLQLHFPKLFTYHHIDIEDEPDVNIMIHFNTCIDFILKALQKRGVVLVHCMAGVSRSSSVVIAYLMCQHKWPYQNAFKHTEKHRPMIYPNLGFREQLQLFEKLNYRIEKTNAEYELYWRTVQEKVRKQDKDRQKERKILYSARRSRVNCFKS